MPFYCSGFYLTESNLNKKIKVCIAFDSSLIAINWNSMFGRDTNTTGVVNVSLSPGEVVFF